MPPREPSKPRFVWKPFNHAYGPWYRLAKPDGDSISGGECVVMPDMDRSRWFWHVRVGNREEPRERRSGHEPDLEAAKRTARATFDNLY